MSEDTIATRLEELRTELRAQRISYGELAELQDLAEHIEPGDVELLEAASVPEFGKDQFTLNIELGNDAMQSPDDVARELRAIASQIESGSDWVDTDGQIIDLNGNTVGRWEVS